MKEGEFTSTQTQDLLDSGLAGTRNDYMKQNSGCDNQQIMSQSLHQLGFNNLES
jgi:hypothetical protein